MLEPWLLRTAALQADWRTRHRDKLHQRYRFGSFLAHVTGSTREESRPVEDEMATPWLLAWGQKVLASYQHNFERPAVILWLLGRLFDFWERRQSWQSKAFQRALEALKEERRLCTYIAFRAMCTLLSPCHTCLHFSHSCFLRHSNSESRRD